MPDNTVFANDPKTASPSVLPKQPLTSEQLLAANLDDLSIEQLDRRAAVVRARKEEMDLQDIKERLDERSTKRNNKSQEFFSRGRELVRTKRSQEQVEAVCRHQKGGRGNEPGGFLRGNDANHSLIKHTLPTNELWVRCSRCGKTWRPRFRDEFSVGTEGDIAFTKAKEEYIWAVQANTDNSPSGSITFQWKSDDHNVTAEKFVRDVMKDVNLK